jgi:hypothetical protein
MAMLLWLLLWRVGMNSSAVPAARFAAPAGHAALGDGDTGYAAAMFAGLLMPAYVQAAFGSTAAESGAMLLPLTGGMIAGSTVAGRVVMVTGRTREPPMAGLLMAAISLILLALLPPSRIVVLVMGATTGLGLGMVMSVTQIISQIAAGPQRLGRRRGHIVAQSGRGDGAATFGYCLERAGRRGRAARGCAEECRAIAAAACRSVRARRLGGQPAAPRSPSRRSRSSALSRATALKSSRPARDASDYRDRLLR